MIRRILVPLDPSPYTDAALKVACAVAKQHGAQITGMAVLDIPGIEKSVGPVPAGGMYYAEQLEEKRETEARERVEGLVAAFSAACEAAGISHRECEHQGSPSEWIVRESVYYDLLVMGLRTYYKFGTDPKGPGDSLEAVLDHCVTPVFGVPKTVPSPDLSAGKIKVLMAFDGSLPAARALKRFCHLVDPRMAAVTLVTAGEDEERARFHLDRAEAYLRAYGIEDVRKEWTTQSIVSVVTDTYLPQADVVVVGAHAKIALFDFAVGSLTKYLIEVESKPVFIGQ